MSLIQFSIKNFRGIVNFSCEPNGKSITLRGANGAGKSNAIDSIFWGLGGNIDGDVVRKGAEKAETEIRFGEYLITRKMKRGKRAELHVKSADGKSTFNSPATLLSGFLGAIERRTFSSRPEKERQEIIRKLAPGLDTSDLDKEHARIFEERTGVNREAKMLHAQADGITVPAMPQDPGEEIDIAEIAGKKAEAEKQKATNEKKKRELSAIINQVAEAEKIYHDNLEKEKALLKEIAEVRENIRLSQIDLDDATNAGEKAKKELANITDPDTSNIDAEIAQAKEKNLQIRTTREQLAQAERAKKEKETRTIQANAKDKESAKLTEKLAEIEKQKKDRSATAQLPVAGLALGANGVTFEDQDDRGPMAIDELSTGQKICLDVLIAKAQGHRLIAVRDASLLDDDARAAIDAFASEHGIQLISEVVASGEDLHAVIEEAKESD